MSKTTENRKSHRYVDANVHSNIAHNRQMGAKSSSAATKFHKMWDINKWKYLAK